MKDTTNTRREFEVWLHASKGTAYCEACEQNVSGPCNSLVCPRAIAPVALDEEHAKNIKKMQKTLTILLNALQIAQGHSPCQLYAEAIDVAHAAIKGIAGNK